MDDPQKGNRAFIDAGLAARVRAARTNAGYTQEGAAEKIGVTQAMIAAIEQGRRGASLWMLREMERLYGVDLYYLMTGRAPAVPEAVGEIAALAAALGPEPEHIRRMVVDHSLDLLRRLKESEQQRSVPRT